MFKVSGGISSKIINEIFQFREKITYELRLFIISIYFLFIQFVVGQKALNMDAGA